MKPTPRRQPNGLWGDVSDEEKAGGPSVTYLDSDGAYFSLLISAEQEYEDLKTLGFPHDEITRRRDFARSALATHFKQQEDAIRDLERSFEGALEAMMGLVNDNQGEGRRRCIERLRVLRHRIDIVTRQAAFIGARRAERLAGLEQISRDEL